jgi:hypothetical protein
MDLDFGFGFGFGLGFGIGLGSVLELVLKRFVFSLFGWIQFWFVCLFFFKNYF